MVVISAGRYGYGGTVVLIKGAITYGLYAAGVGIYVNDERKIKLTVSGSGLLTVVDAPNPLNIYIYGVF